MDFVSIRETNFSDTKKKQMTQSFIKIIKISLKMETITLRCQARTKDKGNEVIYRNELLLASICKFYRGDIKR